MSGKRQGPWIAMAAVLCLCLANTGCTSLSGCDSCKHGCVSCDSHAARELNKVSLPTYVIEPPDVLAIDTLRVVPLPPYKIEPLDILLISAAPVKSPNEPIAGPYAVEPNGTVNLGFGYGTVVVAGMTLDEAGKAIQKHLNKILVNPQVSVGLAQSRAMQLIRGEHLVRQDGTVSLGLYGSVYVAGMTLAEAKLAIEEQLSQYLLRPEVAVDVAAYNSKVYYVIMDGGGFGKTFYRLPITGNETVLDALSQPGINGLHPVSSRNCVWVARPAPAELGGKQVLPVDMVAITEDGATATNYQVLPGDRIYVKADRLIALDNALTKVLQPVNRVFGSMLLGSYAVNGVQGRLSGGGFGFSGGTGR